MPDRFDTALTDAVKAYVGRAAHILERLAGTPDPEALLAVRLAEDAFPTGLHFAVAIQYAARALCPPAGRALPDFPEEPNLPVLRAFAADVSALIENIGPDDLTRTVTHAAGLAELTHTPADYIARYAFPNMIFHLSIGYAGLRLGGIDIGKADFDGLHRY